MFMAQTEENLNDPIDSLKEYGFAKGLLHKLASDPDVSLFYQFHFIENLFNTYCTHKTIILI